MFEDLLGSYFYPPTVQHDMNVKKSYIFVHDHWEEAGEIRFNIESKGLNCATMEFLLPRVDLFADSHADEGVNNWFEWGPRVN